MIDIIVLMNNNLDSLIKTLGSISFQNYKDLNSWGLIETYYGIWAKTGKYMKINGSWKKVNKCFVKINGVWKTVTDIWTKQSGSWKHEI